MTTPITKAVKRLVRSGVSRAGLQSPIRPVYDPANRAALRARAFHMDALDVASFKAASEQVEAERRQPSPRSAGSS